MAMEDVIPSLFVILLIYLLVKWIRKPGSSGSSTDAATIRGVNRGMVDTVHSAFPDMPPQNIIYSLSRTRSVQRTSEDILERGFLSAPPASFNIPASLLPVQAQPISTTSTASTTGSSANGKSSLPSTKSQSLIERYNLATKLPSLKGKEREDAGPVTGGDVGQAAGDWADTKEKRERELRERKEKMILEARRRMMEKQAKAA